MAHENDMPGLLSAKVKVILRHIFINIAIAHLGLLVADSFLIERLI